MCAGEQEPPSMRMSATPQLLPYQAESYWMRSCPAWNM
jgi:hypothetical protein